MDCTAARLASPRLRVTVAGHVREDGSATRYFIVDATGAIRARRTTDDFRELHRQLKDNLELGEFPVRKRLIRVVSRTRPKAIALDHYLRGTVARAKERGCVPLELLEFIGAEGMLAYHGPGSARGQGAEAGGSGSNLLRGSTAHVAARPNGPHHWAAAACADVSAALRKCVTSTFPTSRGGSALSSVRFDPSPSVARSTREASVLVPAAPQLRLRSLLWSLWSPDYSPHLRFSRRSTNRATAVSTVSRPTLTRRGTSNLQKAGAALFNQRKSALFNQRKSRTSLATAAPASTTAAARSCIGSLPAVPATIGSTCRISEGGGQGNNNISTAATTTTTAAAAAIHDSTTAVITTDTGRGRGEVRSDWRTAVSRVVTLQSVVGRLRASITTTSRTDLALDIKPTPIATPPLASGDIPPSLLEIDSMQIATPPLPPGGISPSLKIDSTQTATATAADGSGAGAEARLDAGDDDMFTPERPHPLPGQRERSLQRHTAAGTAVHNTADKRSAVPQRADPTQMPLCSPQEGGPALGSVSSFKVVRSLTSWAPKRFRPTIS